MHRSVARQGKEGDASQPERAADAGPRRARSDYRLFVFSAPDDAALRDKRQRYGAEVTHYASHDEDRFLFAALDRKSLGFAFDLSVCKSVV